MHLLHTGISCAASQPAYKGISGTVGHKKVRSDVSANPNGLILCKHGTKVPERCWSSLIWVFLYCVRLCHKLKYNEAQALLVNAMHTNIQGVNLT